MKPFWYSLLIWSSAIIIGSFLTAYFQHRYSFGEGLNLAFLFSAIYGSLSWFAFLVFFLYFMNEKVKISNAVKIIVCVLSVPILVLIGFAVLINFKNVFLIVDDKLLFTAFKSYLVAGILSMIVWTYIYLGPKRTTQ